MIIIIHDNDMTSIKLELLIFTVLTSHITYSSWFQTSSRVNVTVFASNETLLMYIHISQHIPVHVETLHHSVMYSVSTNALTYFVHHTSLGVYHEYNIVSHIVSSYHHNDIIHHASPIWSTPQHIISCTWNYHTLHR